LLWCSDAKSKTTKLEISKTRQHFPTSEALSCAGRFSKIRDQ
jgi:hypothetical protein